MTLSIERAFAVSLAVHAAIILPFAIEMRAAEPDYDETLVVDLKGVTADEQTEEKVTEQTAGASASQAASAQETRVAQAGENRQSDETPTQAGPATAAKPEKAAPAKATPGSSGSVNVLGGEQQQEAHRIRPRVENPADPLQTYAKALTRRVQTKLVYPEAGRQAGLQGAATVAFTILPDGGLRADSLRIVSSSGQPKLDESALKTIRACVPFDLPPREIMLKITVKYGR